VAKFDADIQLRVAVDRALGDIGKIEKAVQRIQDTRVRLRVDGQREVESLTRSFGRLKSVTKGLFAAGGLGTLSLFLRDINRTPIIGGGLDRLPGAIGAATKALGGLTEAALAGAAAHPLLAAGLTAASVAAVAFAPQIARAAKDTLKLARVAAEAQAPLEQAFKRAGLSLLNLNTAFGDATEAVQAYRTRLYNLSETISELGRRQNALQGALNSTNSGSETAYKIAVKLVDITRRLNDEQAAQNDLLREASGLRPQSVESRATNTYRTQQRKKAYLAEQAAEQADLLAKTRALEAAESDAARTRLAEAAAAKAKALQEQADAAATALSNLRALEAAESSGARARLAANARPVVDRRGAQAYAYPAGPNQRTSGAGRFGAVSNAEIDAAMVRGMRARREAFYKWEAEQQRNQRRIATREAELAAQEQKRIRESLLKGLGGRLSSGAIGGAFPLLFGQSPQAAVGGAIGGLLGGQAGGFAGSLVGTAIGDLQAAQDKVKELGAELGLSSAQVKVLGEAFQQAGRDADKLEAAVVTIQGLGLSSTETASALKLSSELATEYGGKVDKIAQAFADTLESGKVTISTLNRFTAQGIPIQEELARKYGVSRSAILQMAKDGKIPVQDLVNVMVKLGRAAEETANKKTAFEQFTSSVRGLALAVGDLAKNLLSAVLPALNIIITEATKGLNVINNILGAAAEGAKFGLGEAQRKRILTQAQKEAEEIVNRRNIKNPFQRNEVFQQIAAERERDLVRAYGYSTGQLKPEVAGPAAGITPITAPSQLEATDKERREKEKSFYDYSAQNQADLARNAIELSRQVFENEMELARQLYQQKLDYQDKLNKLNAAQLSSPVARDAFNQMAELQKTQQDYITQTRDLDDKIAKARKDLADARAGVSLARLDSSTTKVAGSGSSGKSGRFNVIEYLTGDKSSSGYRADHGGGNYHDHLAFGSQSERDAAMKLLRANGVQIGSVNDGRHAPGSYHYSNQAFDVPGAQVPPGQEPALSARVRGILGIGSSAGVGNQTIAPGGQPNLGNIIGAQGEVDKAQAALDGLLKQQQALTQAQAASKALDMPTAIAESTQGFRDQTAELQKQTQTLQLRTRLEMEGVAPEIIEGELSKLEITQRTTEYAEGLEAAVKVGNRTQEEANTLLEAYKEAAAGAASAVDALTRAQLAAADPINKLMAQWTRNLTDIRGQYAELAQTIASELGSGMSDAITGVITGTQTVGEAFSRMFANIGKAFIDMATQMLAQQVVLSILQGIAGGLAGGFKGFSGAGPYQFPSMGSYSAGFTGSMNFFAEGGLVTGPTRAVLGEGGEPEVVLPQSKIGAAMSNYRPGSGAAGLAQAMNAPESAGGGGALDISYSVTEINSMRFVTEDQFQQGMAVAAQRGAAGGHSRVMGDLRNKRSVRSRLGVG
jgi:tape measure domain-containing protein